MKLNDQNAMKKQAYFLNEIGAKRETLELIGTLSNATLKGQLSLGN